MNEEQQFREILRVVDHSDDQPDPEFLESLLVDIRATASVPRSNVPEGADIITLEARLDHDRTSHRHPRTGPRLVAAAVLLALVAAAAIFLDRSDQSSVASDQTAARACSAFAADEPATLTEVRAAVASAEGESVRELTKTLEALEELEVQLNLAIDLDDDQLQHLRLIVGALKQANSELSIDPARAVESVQEADTTLNAISPGRLRSCLDPLGPRN